MANDPEYIKKQLARLKPISDENPHYTLQLRGFDGNHTNWMNFDAEQLEGIRRVLTGQQGTPSAQWRAAGEADPHGDRYDCERADLAMGDLSDDELANGAFLNYDAPLNLEGIRAGTHSSPIAWMTAVKDRIRWLSRRLEQAKLEATNRG